MQSSGRTGRKGEKEESSAKQIQILKAPILMKKTQPMNLRVSPKPKQFRTPKTASSSSSSSPSSSSSSSFSSSPSSFSKSFELPSFPCSSFIPKSFEFISTCTSSFPTFSSLPSEAIPKDPSAASSSALENSS
ncbi:uncharacterized protein MONOS_15026 [Monocercomonoides exilis]|uniref:uncharacterized protein n=1 Tax=Monocercomonoides exilis TaxID=2049356 RepID=UPI0035599D2F|nr:hypothetical protein MONOS_15026 [Monocercomonoides exilis]|eukprot:MONOS_15026.1-p1 / transcript=MONOS_15026.1 / gene=MONOS_15026 / organism=Monocercomonoides_exilis_PA203 / gene_product=unspecified product / transcript_product=unspecified product / location=Mono_scaffold01129:10496-10894(+) / protein_length=133 / sequence_SO=supercontig / SO=protein_coding / is_pseudo=false